jgi:hypothetical protein
MTTTTLNTINPNHIDLSSSDDTSASSTPKAATTPTGTDATEVVPIPTFATEGAVSILNDNHKIEQTLATLDPYATNADFGVSTTSLSALLTSAQLNSLYNGVMCDAAVMCCAVLCCASCRSLLLIVIKLLLMLTMLLQPLLVLSTVDPMRARNTD